ncbi:RNA polymerase sigma factor [Tepidiforma thermophila]|uniref:RNA polymerase RpoE-like sigma-24 subunit n=1 Tax=Tepidiforma thermophila (strain KCTC 52669 / CGMCC 1.13589 / G233) TaxID=2761530 RepID=A0A2A9HFM9_TEPT2|nr:sigma-70 family RNA polymerase sigma factor [Tepidiforma thermophila]PFG73941.1 RNA polymerase RpoE-like sigma-24 subunit [Tepidiforma thermophila]
MADMLEPPDEHLVSLSKDGNLAAFNSLVDRYQSIVFSLCYRLIGERTAAEDAAQETFLSAFRALHQFSGGSFRGWLLRIATNCARDELRRRMRRIPARSLAAETDDDLAIDPPAPGADPALALDDRTLGPALEAALRSLPPDQREVVLLADVHGLQYEEIVAITGVTMGTVKSRLFRARERLRRALQRRPELFTRSGRLHDRGEQ